MGHTQSGHVLTEVILQSFKYSGLLTVVGDQLTKEFCLSSARWKILGALARSDKPLTVAQISRVMGQTRQSVQRLVDIMQQQDLLSFIDNPKHKTAKLVNMSSSGLSIFQQLEQKQIIWVNQLASELDATDLKTTLNMLERLTGNLEKSFIGAPKGDAEQV